jgi:carboxymethylenebutenolidase
MTEVVESEMRSLYGDPRAVDRRTFIVTSLSAGFAAAVLPVSAQTITTPADGLTAGEVKVPTEDGAMVAYRAMPAGKSNVPVILVVSEVWGAHEYIRDVARRFAKLGYYAIAPELFARAGDAGKYTDTQALLKEIVAKTPDAQVMADLDAAVGFARSEKADTGKLGITSIPTMHVYQNGEIVKTIIGAMPKPKLLRELEPYLG